MIPVIKWTLWARRRSTISWSLGVFALIILNLSFYPSFKNDAAELQKSFENLPDAALQLMGGSTDFFSPIGFLNSQVYYLMLPLLLIILAISLGSNLLAREEQDGTVELLLARPISRTRLLGAKAAVAAIVLGIVSIVGLVSTLVVGQMVGLEVAMPSIVATTFVCYLLALSCGAIAYTMTALGKARSASFGVATVVALGGYLVTSLSGTVDWLSGPSKLFPFEYYQSESILRGQYDWYNVLFYLFVLIATAVISWMAFRGRDIG